LALVSDWLEPNAKTRNLLVQISRTGRWRFTRTHRRRVPGRGPRFDSDVGVELRSSSTAILFRCRVQVVLGHCLIGATKYTLGVIVLSTRGGLLVVGLLA
jgi:hypothetical protein